MLGCPNGKELASKASARKGMGVRIPLPAPFFPKPFYSFSALFLLMAPKEKKEKTREEEEVSLDKIMEHVSDSSKDVDVIVEEVKDTGKDVDEIKEEVVDTGKDIDEIKEEVKDTGKDVDRLREDIGKLKSAFSILRSGQHIIARKLDPRRLIPEEFHFDDLAQQIVGAMILSAPLAVTQEVWRLAQQLDIARVLVLVGIALLFDILLIYFTKYQVVKEEKILSFIPTRLFSLVLVSYVTAAIMLCVFGVIGNEVTDLSWALRLVIFVGLFANIGAGTADILK